MKTKFLIRLDDACPTMDGDKWIRMFSILDQYGVHPMIGIIPNNEDPLQRIDEPDGAFWEFMKEREHGGDSIALHGYNHCYISSDAGINPLWHRSEFAGVDFDIQSQKIKDGYSILKEHGLNPKYFFAPSHTFDNNTLRALETCTPIRIISDTIATRPYRKGSFTYIPQLGGSCREMKLNGIWTFCLHPSAMSEEQFSRTEAFLKAHKDSFTSFDALDLTGVKGKSVMSRLLSWTYFTIRKLRGVR